MASFKQNHAFFPYEQQLEKLIIETLLHTKRNCLV